jgi:hypothetical protein
MWGRATLTMVVSRTTMSWAVRMTNRNTDGRDRRRPRACEPGFPARGRDDKEAVGGMYFDLSYWYSDN